MRILTLSYLVAGNGLKGQIYEIGTYFKILDHLISLQQKEIVKLKQIKTSCLSKMFV